MSKLFENKGKLATIIGLLVSLPFTLYYEVQVMIGGLPDDITKLQYLMGSILTINLIGIVWFMLPSKIKIDGKWIKVELED